jgi:hypothetical protein
MTKHLTNLTSFHAKTNRPIGSWHSALKNWREARSLHKQEMERAEFVAHLTHHNRYDIGETDCRRRRQTDNIGF